MRERAQWTGAAADGFGAFTAGVGSGVSGAQAPLSQIAGAVRTYAGALDAAQRQAAAAKQSAASASAAGTSRPAPSVTAQAAADHAEAQRASSAADASAEESKHGIDAAVEELNKLWEKTEPVRAWLEKIKAPWDASGFDKALGMVQEKGESAAEGIEKWEKKLPDLERQWFNEDVATVAHEYDNGLASAEDLDAAWARVATKMDAAEGFVSGWASDTWLLRGALPFVKGLKVFGGVTAAIGDAGTLISPEDSGVMGGVDRVAAGTNLAGLGVGTAEGLGLIEADGALAAVPGVGEVAVLGTGIYLGGDYLYHHWKPFRNVCNSVGHTTVTVAKDVGHGVSTAVHDVGSWLGL